MARVTAQAMTALVLKMELDMAPLQINSEWKKTAVRTVFLILTAVFLCIAQEIMVIGSKKTQALRSDSGKALWSGGSQRGGFGSSSGGRTGGGSSGAGRGRR